ncbi:MAG: cytochrome c biogenesis protein CcsA [Paludibacteraceae bacterium]|nr:cytochrome c biogenesis protein CcsA [Paludibacteraceae bacterium]
MNINRDKIAVWSRNISFILLGIQIVQMAAYTFMERFSNDIEMGSLFTTVHFWSIWALLAFFGLVMSFTNKNIGFTWRLGIHLAFIFILLGACISYLFSEKGTIFTYTNKYTQALIKNNGDVKQLPFKIKLRSFDIKYYNGTDTPQDYKAYITIKQNGEENYPEISMNNIFVIDGYRLYLTSYDDDRQGIQLTTTYDKWGVIVTYIGYLILLVSLIAYGFDKTRWLALFKNPLLRGLTVLLLILMPSTSKAAYKTFDKNTSESFGQIHMLYQGRVSLIETYAIDFTKKIYGKDSYEGYTANQVLAGWLFNEKYWRREKIIKTKRDGYFSLDDALETLESRHCAPKLKEELNDKIGLIESLKRGDELTIFPFRIQNSAEANVVWLTPRGKDPRIDEDTQNKVKGVLSLLYREIDEETNNGEIWINKFRYLQHTVLGEGHNESFDYMEHFYNKYCNIKLLAMISLTLGIVAFAFVVFMPGRIEWKEKSKKCLSIGNYIIFFSVLSIQLLRTFISGHLQFSNGFETMLCIACFASGLATVLAKRVYATYIATFLITGFALLISSMGLMNPEITHIVPVLASKWLSVHVMLMMIAYTLFGLMFICSCTSITLWLINHNEEELMRYTLLNKIMLYPAVTFICGGIFTGAVWANSSWGTYWNWDPKETWALITMLLYSLALHNRSLKKMDSPLFFQCYTMLCFFSLLITYFGVNYVFGGMHSYAN